MSFQSDLKESQARELELLEHLSYLGFYCKQSEGLFPGFDLSVYHPGVPGSQHTLELKYQRMTPETNKIAIELFKWEAGERKPSGLTHTTATWMVIAIPGDRHFYLIKPMAILNLLIQKQHLRITRGGYKMNYVLALFDRETFLRECDRL